MCIECHHVICLRRDVQRHALGQIVEPTTGKLDMQQLIDAVQLQIPDTDVTQMLHQGNSGTYPLSCGR